MRWAGWSVVTGREPDLCLARYSFTLNGSPRVAEFAFLRLPAPHLVPFNDQASDISDLGDSIIAASDGVSHGTGRRLRAWSETYAEKIHLARAMRNDRERGREREREAHATLWAQGTGYAIYFRS
jgi:hypothetical protein